MQSDHTARDLASLEHLLQAIRDNNLATLEACLNSPTFKTRGVNVSNTKGQTPLGLAVNLQRSAVTKRLLKANASPNFVTQSGISPLMIACYHTDLTLVQLLLESGAKIHHFAGNQSPFNIALTKNFIEAAQLLVPQSDAEWLLEARCCLRDLNRCTPNTGFAWFMEHAPSNPAPELVSIYQECLDKACADGQLENVKILMAQGAQADVITSLDGSSPLHYAVLSNNLELIDYLIAHGARLDYAKRDGVKPFDLSYTTQKPKVLVHLIEHHRVELAPKLIMALMTSLYNHDLETLNCLLERTLDPNVSYGDFDLVSWAIEQNFPQGLKAVLKAGALAPPWHQVRTSSGQRVSEEILNVLNEAQIQFLKALVLLRAQYEHEEGSETEKRAEVEKIIDKAYPQAYGALLRDKLFVSLEPEPPTLKFLSLYSSKTAQTQSQAQAGTPDARPAADTKTERKSPEPAL